MENMKSKRRILAAGTALALMLAAPQAALAQAGGQKQQERRPGEEKAEKSQTVLDIITISATQVRQAVIDSLSGTSFVGQEEAERIQANNAADLFRTTPGVAASMNGDDPATAVNIRGLEQYGRVVVTLDGARQDYWRVGHGSGSFYVEPELIRDVTVIRGPVSNSYGSGGIGGVVAFETKDAGDFLRRGETWALSEKLGWETNGDGATTSTTGAYRFNENVDFLGNIVWRDRNAYEDGNGDTVPWTGETVRSGYFKGTLRPGEDQELKLGAILQRYDDYVTGSSGSATPTLSRYDAETVNHTYTAAYTWNPDDPLIDLGVNLYHNDTRAAQTQVWPASAIGNFRYYDVATTGISVKNSSRIDGGFFDHTLTYGADFNHLEGTSNAAHFGAGNQNSWGAFLQWQGDHGDWLEVIGALRYDGYRLDGQTRATPPQDASLSGNRLSPRLTVGVTPVEGLQVYATYAEGYRSPMLQDVFRGGGAHGSTDTYRPNLLLQPEIARTLEAGVNARYDGLFNADDQFRAKLNLFHTKVEDYIDVDLTGIRMAQNIGDARLNGIELEGIYDFSFGFVNLTGALINAEMTSGVYRGQALTNTPLDRASATLGLRSFDERLTWGGQYIHVGDITRTSRSNPAAAPVGDEGFNLVNLFADWQINDNARLGFAVENLFDVAYTDPQSAWSTSALTEQGKGLTFKINLTARIGG